MAKEKQSRIFLYLNNDGYPWANIEGVIYSLPNLREDVVDAFKKKWSKNGRQVIDCRDSERRNPFIFSGKNKERATVQPEFRHLFNNLEPDTYMEKAIVVDVDGTLAHKGNRNPFKWSEVGNDTVDSNVSEIVRRCSHFGDIVIIVSGRDEVCRPETEEWLKRHCIPFDFLFMRKKNDNRQDAVIKEEIYRQEIEGKFDVRFVLDDRNQTVEMWRNIGLVCWQVAPGDF